MKSKKSSTSKRPSTAKSKKNDNIYGKKKQLQISENVMAVEEVKKLYLKYYASPNIAFTNQLKTEQLAIYLNKFSFTDIQIINRILAKYHYFKYIELAPSDPQRPEKSKARSKYNPLSEGEKDQLSKEMHDKELETQNIINKISMGIAKHLALSKNLNTFAIYNMKFNSENIKYLSQGLADNTGLSSLIISGCTLSIPDFEVLTKGLLTHENLTLLDIRGNELTDNFGSAISRIIARQTERRDLVVWSYGLRNEKPLTNEYAKGLISVNLSGNHLSRYSAESISNALSYDQYIRLIDLSGNNFDSDSCKLFIHMMRRNKTLLTVDLRDNPGYDEDLNKRMIMKMSKNIRVLFEMFQKGEYNEEEFEYLREFIDISFFEVEVPQYIVELYNSMLLDQQQLEEQQMQINENNQNQENDNINNINDNNINNEINNNINMNNMNDINNMNMQEIKEGDEYDEEEQQDNEGNMIENEEQGVIKNNENLNDLQMDYEKLQAENLILKQQIIELKANALKNQLENNDTDNNKNNDINNNQINNQIAELNNIDFNDPKNLKQNYNLIVNLLSKVNEIMDKVQDSKDSERHKEMEKLKKLVKENNGIEENDVNIDNQNINEEEKEEENIDNNINSNNSLPVSSNKKSSNNTNVGVNDNSNNNTNNNKNNINNSNVSNSNSKNLSSSKEQKQNQLKNKVIDNNNINIQENSEKYNQNLNDNSNNIIDSNKKNNDDINNINDNTANKDNLDNNQENIEYEPYPAEPSEHDNVLYDEEGNEINFDDLDDEDKIAILQQQAILKKMQEEAEARGEHFDPQEYLMMLEQAAAEEEEMMKMQGENDDNKLNKSF